MYIYQLIFSLFIVTIINQEFILNPIYPPTCYLTKNYLLQFHIKRQRNFSFSFNGLPKGLSGSEDGMVTGIAYQPGSYSIVIQFSKDGFLKGKKQIILHVVEADLWSKETTFPNQNINELSIIYPDKFIFYAGSEINYQLSAKNSILPLLWSYKNLPDDLSSDQQGLIFGRIQSPGLYLFTVECSDSRGYYQQVYLQFNIQPKTNTQRQFLSEVPYHKFELDYDIDEVIRQQRNVDESLFQTLQQLHKKQVIKEQIKKQVFSAGQEVEKINKKLQQINKQYQILIKKELLLSKLFKEKLRVYKLSCQILKLSTDQQKDAIQYNYNGTYQLFVKAQKAMNNANKSRDQNQNHLTMLKNKIIQQEQNLKIIKNNKLTLQKQYDKALLNYQQQRKKLEQAKYKKQMADLLVQQANLKLTKAQSIRQAAFAQFSQAQQIEGQLETDYQMANNKIARLRSEYIKQQQEMRRLEWEFELQLNKLYVAQARKQTADRASAIAVAQAFDTEDDDVGLYPVEIYLKQIQVDCERSSFPAIQGIVKITQVIDNGYKVSSGHRLFFGKCASYLSVNIGSTVHYKGLLVNGLIQVTKFQELAK